MKLDTKLVGFYIIVLFLWNGPSLFAQTEPLGLFLTWNNDPTSSMIIDWHTPAKEKADPRLYFRKMGTDQWNEAVSQSINFPHSNRTIHRVALAGLEPETRYQFQTGNFGRTYWFETMPKNINDKPLIFAIGGDTYDRGHEARHIWMNRMNRTIMRYDPKFIVWGGDLAYADGLKDQVWRWHGWFDAIMETLIAEDGKVTPILVAIGNHEVNKSYFSWGDDYQQTDTVRETSAPFFYNLFAFPGQPGYNKLDFGNYLSLIMLDTDHTNPIHGKQAKWLAKTLDNRQHLPHVFPVYHVPAFPSTNEFSNHSSMRVRKFWLPLFDQYDVPMVFEYHDHAYKRTPPIKYGKIDAEGTVYVGDGGWGTGLRDPHNSDETWYLQRISRSRHGVIVSLYGSQRYIRAVSENGNIIDEFPNIFPHLPAAPSVSSLSLGGGINLSAELAEHTGSIYIDSDYPGYTEGGFAVFEEEGQPGTALSWNVPIEHEGYYNVRIRYANDSGDQLLQLFINGKLVKDSLSFAETESWKKWVNTDAVSVKLEAGINKIKLDQVLPNKIQVDRLEVSPE